MDHRALYRNGRAKGRFIPDNWISPDKGPGLQRFPAESIPGLAPTVVQILDPLKLATEHRVRYMA